MADAAGELRAGKGGPFGDVPGVRLLGAAHGFDGERRFGGAAVAALARHQHAARAHVYVVSVADPVACEVFALENHRCHLGLDLLTGVIPFGLVQRDHGAGDIGAGDGKGGGRRAGVVARAGHPDRRRAGGDVVGVGYRGIVRPGLKRYAVQRDRGHLRRLCRAVVYAFILRKRDLGAGDVPPDDVKHTGVEVFESVIGRQVVALRVGDHGRPRERAGVAAHVGPRRVPADAGQGGARVHKSVGLHACDRLELAGPLQRLADAVHRDRGRIDGVFDFQGFRASVRPGEALLQRGNGSVGARVGGGRAGQGVIRARGDALLGLAGVDEAGFGDRRGHLLLRLCQRRAAQQA